MPEFRRELDLARAFEVAFDLLLANDALDRVDGIVVGTIERPRQWQAKPVGRGADVDRQAVVAVPAIAAG